MNVSYDFPLTIHRALTFTDESTPFTRLRGAGEVSKANPTAGHATKGPSRARTATSNRRVVQLPSKRGQAVRAGPAPMAGSSNKSPQISLPTRPATATGRMASTSLIGPVSTLRVHARPATSVSLRPPTAIARTVGNFTKSQPGTRPLVADPQIVLEFEGVGLDVGNDDFMFDV